MFERLRKRFILTTMAAVAGVLVCVGFAINLTNYAVTVHDLDDLLEALHLRRDGRGGAADNG